ncbi:MAG: hypothetical protein WC770_06925 [Phycisphaerae bacterium]
MQTRLAATIKPYIITIQKNAAVMEMDIPATLIKLVVTEVVVQRVNGVVLLTMLAMTIVITQNQPALVMPIKTKMKYVPDVQG